MVVILSIGWTFCEASRVPHYMLFVYGMVVFFLLRAVATFTIPWRSFRLSSEFRVISSAGMRKVFETVYDAVRSAGGRA
jgi:hypothetical protein